VCTCIILLAGGVLCYRSDPVAKRVNVKGASKEASKPRKRGRPPRRETVTPDLPGGTRVIKRYGNRRLYDHTLSRAVTMNDLAAAVRKGEDFRVFDGELGDDVTRRVLLQIMLEEQNELQLNVLPIDFLRLLIQLLNAGAEWLSRNISETASGTGVRSFEDSLAVMFPWFKRDRPGEPAAAAGAAPAGGEKKSDAGDLVSEIVNMQTRLADLAKRVTRR
jgi:polyhydroxyalkanoate synthesis repressor PhaR